jgi:hypothetical protein
MERYSMLNFVFESYYNYRLEKEHRAMIEKYIDIVDEFYKDKP